MGELIPTTEGTPQGGVISPLLANIALHGFESVIRDAFPERKPGTNIHWKPIVVRYADDFVVMHEDETAIHQVQQRAIAWLAGMGLELKPSKTKITHTLSTHNGNIGFDFLGFTVRQFPAGKTHTGKSGGKGRVSTPLGFKTIIKPSHEAIRRHSLALAEIVDQHKPAPQAALIARLNPVIRGWATYYAPVQSKKKKKKKKKKNTERACTNTIAPRSGDISKSGVQKVRSTVTGCTGQQGWVPTPSFLSTSQDC